MHPLGFRATLALCAALVVCLAAGRSAAQDKPTTMALVERYLQGDFDAVVTALEATDKNDFDDILDDLKKHGPAWIAAGGADDRVRRELAAATFALEAARAAEWLDWKIVQGIDQISVRRMVGSLPVGGDGFKNADLLYWQPAPRILEWGCALSRSAAWPEGTLRIFQLAALAVAERGEDFEFLVGSPFATRGNADEEIEHLKHAVAKLPNERRLALAQGIALEWRSFPERVKGQAGRGPGVKEAQAIFENLQNDEVVGAEARLRLGSLRLRLGAADPALKLFAEVEVVTRDPFLVYLARYFRGQALERKQEWAGAESAYRGALATIPRAQSASMGLAALLAKRGARADAEAVVAANLAAHPQPVDPWRAYGDGDDRFWPELISRLRQQIKGSDELKSGINSIGTDLVPFELIPDFNSSWHKPRAVHGPAVEEQQPQTPVFRTASDLVTVGVAVRASGSPVGGLRASDFLVLDNGVPQKIESIDSEAVPADITVLVESSEGVKDYIGSVNSQLQKILAQLRPDDRVRILNIDTYVTELLPLQRVGDGLKIGKLPLGGLASAHDGLAAALLLSSDPQRRQLIIAISDTIDAISTLTAETVRDIARQSPAELHIAWVTLIEQFPPKVYVSTPEREPHATCGATGGCSRRRFWRPYSQTGLFRMEHDFKAIIEAAELTGGKAYLPGIFTNWTASSIFSRIYDDYRHSYVIRYSPQGVKREGWHELAVTLPKYPNVDITARRGYSGDASTALPSTAPAGQAVSPSYDTVATSYRLRSDVVSALKAFGVAGNLWPAAPDHEAVLALELADAGFRSGRDEGRAAGAILLLAQRQLVQRPIAPDEFERLWLWTALSSFEAMIRPGFADPFLKAALKRMPNEPRLVLGRAILADQLSPIGTVSEPEPSAAARVAEVSGLYDAAMKYPDTEAEARVRKAWLLHRTAHNAEALALLDAANPRATDRVLVFWRDLFRGQVLDTLGRGSDAIAAFRAALAAFPQSQSANVALMNALVRRGERDEPKVIAERIQKLPAGEEDPYWLYWAADYRFVGAAMTRLRELARTSAESIK